MRSDMMISYMDRGIAIQPRFWIPGHNSFDVRLYFCWQKERWEWQNGNGMFMEYAPYRYGDIFNKLPIDDAPYSFAVTDKATAYEDDDPEAAEDAALAEFLSDEPGQAEMYYCLVTEDGMKPIHQSIHTEDKMMEVMGLEPDPDGLPLPIFFGRTMEEIEKDPDYDVDRDSNDGMIHVYHKSGDRAYWFTAACEFTGYAFDDKRGSSPSRTPLDKHLAKLRKLSENDKG